MARLPDTLVYALWIVGACWVVAIIAYLVGGPTDLIVPLFFLGVFTGFVEWLLRHNTN
jgi:H+/Cl- antiporter ClcA